MNEYFSNLVIYSLMIMVFAFFANMTLFLIRHFFVQLRDFYDNL